MLFAPGLTAEDAGGQNPESLIRNIETRSCLVISDREASSWSRGELETIIEVLSYLPDSVTRQKSIHLERGTPTLPSPTTVDTLFDIHKLERALVVRGIKLEDLHDGQQRIRYLGLFKRALVFNLALMFYRDLDKETATEWMRYALWTVRVLFPDTSRNIDTSGFANAIGMRSPEYDFASFAVEYFLSPEDRESRQSIRCRLPGRYAFFETLFDGTIATSLVEPCEQGYRAWINPEEVEEVEVIITTPTSSSPASIAGHALLLIKRRSDFHDGRDSLVLGFVGETSVDKNNGIDGLTYVYRGLTGYYRSLLQQERLREVVQRATILENRDVQRFKLKLTTSETEALIQRLWVVRNTFTYEYQFFNQNCVSMLLDVLNHVFPPEDRVLIHTFIAAPMHIVASLYYSGRLEGFVYPEYQSVWKKARYASQKNERIKKEILASLESIPVQQNGDGVVIYKEIKTLFGMVSSVGGATLSSDPLFREPVLVIDDTGRAAAYVELVSRFIDVYHLHVEKTQSLSREEYHRLADLLMRYLLQANDRELYIAVPDDTRRRFAKGDPIPANISKDFVEDQLHRVQLRERNSREMQGIRRAISFFRIFLDVRYPDSSIFTVGRALQDEFGDDLAESRENIAFSHGYYPKTVSVGYRYIDGRNYLGAAFESAVFQDDMGHNSVFALKQDMSMALLASGYDVWIGLDQNPFVAEEGRSAFHARFTAFDFSKILIDPKVDYAGFFNHGFGLTVFDADAILWNGASLLHGTATTIKVLEGRYLLNIFERGDFRQFLNLSVGAGYELERTGKNTVHSLTLPAGLEAKMHLVGDYDNVFRFSCTYECHLDFTGPIHSELAAESTVAIGLGSRRNTVLCAGIDLTMQFPVGASDTTDITCYLRSKF